MQLMLEFEKGGDEAEIRQKVFARSETLWDEWPLPNEDMYIGLSSPIEELICLMDLILHRITHLLSTHLEEVVG